MEAKHYSKEALLKWMTGLVEAYDKEMTVAYADIRAGRTYEGQRRIADAGAKLRYAIELYPREIKAMSRDKSTNAKHKLL